MPLNNTFLPSCLVLLLIVCGCQNGDASLSPGSTGLGGSITHFAVNGDRLYVVDRSHIIVFNIADNTFTQLNKVKVENGLETIFSRGDYLYLGAADAMYIYSIADRDAPEFIFRYAHIVSCDPVVVQGNRAYVTLRSGTACNRGANALEILDISNPYSPTLIANYPLTSPHGLAVDGNRLFICEGEAGLKMFDITNELMLQMLTHVNTVFAYDVIARDGLLTLTGEDGIFQYQYGGSENNLEEISKIEVNREAQ